MRDRRLDQLPQHREIHVLELLHVQARFARPVLAEPSHQRGETLEAGHQVEREVVFPGREGDHRPLALASARVAVPVFTEADDAGAPHPRSDAGRGLHQPDQRVAVLAPGSPRGAVQELLDARVVLPRLQLCHDRAPGSVTYPGQSQPNVPAVSSA